MGEPFGSNHAQLIHDATVHLNSEVNAKDEFVLHSMTLWNFM